MALQPQSFALVADGIRLGIVDADIAENGMCVTGCVDCREWRNKIRAALAQEQQALSDASIWDDLYGTYDDVCCDPDVEEVEPPETTIPRYADRDDLVQFSNVLINLTHAGTAPMAQVYLATAIENIAARLAADSQDV